MHKSVSLFLPPRTAGRPRSSTSDGKNEPTLGCRPWEKNRRRGGRSGAGKWGEMRKEGPEKPRGRWGGEERKAGQTSWKRQENTLVEKPDPFYRWGNWGPEKLGNLPKATHSVSTDFWSVLLFVMPGWGPGQKRWGKGHKETGKAAWDRRAEAVHSLDIIASYTTSQPQTSHLGFQGAWLLSSQWGLDPWLRGSDSRSGDHGPRRKASSTSQHWPPTGHTRLLPLTPGWDLTLPWLGGGAFQTWVNKKLELTTNHS